MLKTLSASALIVAMATASFAGSLVDATVEPAPSEPEFVPVVGSGIGAPVIIGAVVAAAAIAAVLNNDDDEASTTATAD